MRKALSILLALCLALSLGGMAFASGGPSGEASGGIKNYVYQRSVEVTPDNTAWSGASPVWEADDWNAFWDYADGMDSV